MIKYLKRNQIDIQKYDTCIELAINSRIYAYSWYLDIVADNWDALVLNDYEAVMPLPWRQKYFIKYVYPPAWTQQLGVFSTLVTSQDLILNFIKAIPRKFKKITIQFNSENKFHHKNLTERINYILPLNNTYEEIHQKYRKDRKKRLRQLVNKDESLHFSDGIDFQLLKNLFIKFYKSKVEINSEDFNRLEKFIKYGLDNNAQIFGVLDENSNFLSGLLVVKDSKRIIVLFSATSPLGFENNAFSFLIDNVIKKYSYSNYTLDFEGSNIKSIASFNKSFGAEKEVYFNFKKNLIG